MPEETDQFGYTEADRRMAERHYWRIYGDFLEARIKSDRFVLSALDLVDAGGEGNDLKQLRENCLSQVTDLHLAISALVSTSMASIKWFVDCAVGRSESGINRESGTQQVIRLQAEADQLVAGIRTAINAAIAASNRTELSESIFTIDHLFTHMDDTLRLLAAIANSQRIPMPHRCSGEDDSVKIVETASVMVNLDDPEQIAQLPPPIREIIEQVLRTRGEEL